MKNFFLKPINTIFKKNNIRACYLFGSQAASHITEESDFDMAVFVDDKRDLNYKKVLTEIVGSFFSPEKLHLSIVDIRNTSPLFLFQIIKNGKLIYEFKKNYHILLESIIMRMYYYDQYRYEIFFNSLKQKYVPR